MASASLPTATNFPSLIATALARGFSRSTVCRSPLKKIMSAVMLPPVMVDGVEPAAAAKGSVDHRSCDCATVYGQNGPGDHARSGTGQKDHSIGDFMGLGITP